jgi:hypothetical protein
MGRVVAEVELANNEDVLKARAGTLPADQVRRTRLPGVIDTGAARLVIPGSVWAQPGLHAAGETNVRYADKRSATRPMVSNVWLELQGREGVFKAVVEPDRSDALVGAIVLEDLDFVIDCVTQTLQPRDPDRIISEVE